MFGDAILQALTGRPIQLALTELIAVKRTRSDPVIALIGCNCGASSSHPAWFVKKNDAGAADGNQDHEEDEAGPT